MAEKRKYADRREELIKAVAKRRRKIKLLSVQYKVGQKSFGIGDKGYTRSWEKTKQELDKCILVCANCHREIEAGITQLPKETLG